jgi:hypothetical protein
VFSNLTARPGANSLPNLLITLARSRKHDGLLAIQVKLRKPDAKSSFAHECSRRRILIAAKSEYAKLK